MNNDKSLLLFSIGPVQSFISTARKKKDLWSGSYILSYLAEQIISYLLNDQKVQLIFPARNKESLDSHFKNPNTVKIASIPNRILCKVEMGTEDTKELAKKLEFIVKEAFQNLCLSCVATFFKEYKKYQNDFIPEITLEQLSNFLEIFWAIEPLGSDKDFKEARNRIEQRLSAIKNNRFYTQTSQSGYVCTMCGQQSQITELTNKSKSFNKKIFNSISTFKINTTEEPKFKEQEKLCSICLSKRLAFDYFKKIRSHSANNSFQSFPSTIVIADNTDYYAVLMMDGDDMGKIFSNSQTADEHRKISQQLERFALFKVPEIIKKHEGVLIYAGGDDVLAFLPVKNALTAAAELRKAFSDPINGLGNQATSSMGMVIAHEKAPLQQVLNNVRKMEAIAKEYINPVNKEKRKNAFALAIHTHGGEIRQIVLPWYYDNQDTIAILNDLIEKLSKQMSSTFLYAFGDIFLPLLGGKYTETKKFSIFKEQDKNKTLLHTEFKRLLKRSLLEKKNEEKVDKIVNQLLTLHEVMNSSFQFIHLLEIIAFFKRMEKKGGENQ